MPLPNKKIFCNTPWYELHIYWDGGLGICCQEHHRLYNIEKEKQYNISKMSIAEWFNSEPVKKMRMDIWSNKKLSLCERCYRDEITGPTSRRHKSNQKSVIFTKSAFEDSIEQSPHYDNFLYSKDNQGHTLTLPVDLHIDIGNFCNLSCKMCSSPYSSKIAAQQVKWGKLEDKKYIGTDWTQDTDIWNKFLEELSTMKLKNIHFMGGETILTKKFHDFLNFMIKKKRFDLNFSFVTNGTTFDLELMKKLKLFQRVGIEVSIETTTEHNDYIRQGTITKEVLKNIEKYTEYCDNDRISLTMRPAVGALTIGNYDSLLEYCLIKKLQIKPNVIYRPSFLQVSILPIDIRKKYLKKYYELLKKYDLEELDLHNDFNESDPQQYKKIIKIAAEQAIGLLNLPLIDNHEKEFDKMVEHCKRWDKLYGFDALLLFPELNDLLIRHGY